VVYGITFNAKGWWVQQSCTWLHTCSYQWYPPTVYQAQSNPSPHPVGAVFGQMYTLPKVIATWDPSRSAYAYLAYTWDHDPYQSPHERTETNAAV